MHFLLIEKITVITFMCSLFACNAFATDMTHNMTNASDVTQTWAIESAATVSNYSSGLSKKRNEKILVWINGENHVAAVEAHLLTATPFDQVQPAVQRELEQLGGFKFESATETLGNLYPEWIEVLLSRRLELRTDLAQQFEYPKLALALKLGAITPDELESRMISARDNLEYLSGLRFQYAEHAAFSNTYKSFRANKTKSYGLFSTDESRLHVTVLDVSAVFGYAATAVKIVRFDTYSNPARDVPQKFNILRTTSASVEGLAVPADAFESIRKSIESISSGVELKISAQAQTWSQHVAQKADEKKPIPMSPNCGNPQIQPEIITWEGSNQDKRKFHYMYTLLPLPDGDVLISVEEKNGSLIQRLHEKEGRWDMQTIWEGKAGARKLEISADGRTVWFRGTSTAAEAPQMHTYDVKSHKIHSYTVERADANRHIDTEGLSRSAIYSIEFDRENANERINKAYWQLTGFQLPVFFDRVQNGRLLDGYQYEVVESAGPAASESINWPFHTAFSNGREAYVSQNPVRWRSTNSYWFEDSLGLTEIESKNGRVLRTIRLPSRNGTSIFSQGYPEYQYGHHRTPPPSGAYSSLGSPLGSPEAGWIAVPFLNSKTDNGDIEKNACGQLSNASKHTQNDKYYGMHLVDTKPGTIRHSVLLGNATDGVKAIARSPNGRMLAFGAQRPETVALWDVGKGISQFALTNSTNKELKTLAFSWDGKYLWGLYLHGLHRWKLPVSQSDAAVTNSFPDQSQY